MAVQITENVSSRSFDLGRDGRYALTYTVTGTDDETEVLSVLGETSSSIFDGLIRDAIAAEPLGNGVWTGTVRYRIIENTNEYTFDTGGGTQRITQSLATAIFGCAGAYDDYGDDIGPPPDFGGAIGVDGDRVEGVDITVPQYEFSETHLLSSATVTQAYKMTLFRLTGKVNNASFKGLDAGECLFLGAAGTQRGDQQWAITFRFAGSPNQSNIQIGCITVDFKAGWDYMWVRYDDFEDEHALALVKRPVAAYVEQVYERDDFSQMGIGT